MQTPTFHEITPSPPSYAKPK